MNVETFEACLKHHLLPTLEEGDIVVLDNLKAHKSSIVAQILARKNCTVRYLPPYSPDFNPIEMAISKLKSALRKLAERTLDGLLAILQGCAGLFKPAHCQSYFKACGYDPAELQVLYRTCRIRSAARACLRITSRPRDGAGKLPFKASLAGNFA